MGREPAPLRDRYGLMMRSASPPRTLWLADQIQVLAYQVGYVGDDQKEDARPILQALTLQRRRDHGRTR
jgi:hypothetical protein